MAQVVWTEPALADLDAIADYIALDNPQAARELVERVFAHVEKLASRPRRGPKVPEFRGWRYRQVVEPPCRVIYRPEKGRAYIVHVVRSERRLDTQRLKGRDKDASRK